MCHAPTAARLAIALTITGLLGCRGAAEQPSAPAGPAPGAATRPSPHSAGERVDTLDPRIWKAHEDRRGQLWFGSNGAGVYRFDGATITRFGPEHGLVGRQVRDIVEDRHGHVFVATNAGVTRFDDSGLTPLEIVEAPEDGSGWRLDPDDVWIVFDPGREGPSRVDGDRLVRLSLPPSPAAGPSFDDPGPRFTSNGVYTIHRDRRGHLWFGTADHGLCRYDGFAHAWLYERRLTTTPSGGAFGIRSIHQDQAGDFWICNTRQRFAIDAETRMVGGEGVLSYIRSAGLPGAETDDAPNFDYYADMIEEPDGTLWMACGSSGVWRFDGEAVTKFAMPPESWTMDLLQDRHGTIWACTTDHGVFRFDGERFIRYEGTPGGTG